MRIIFICGSLEPGKDGVGDYTQRLASGLTLHSHQCVIIALMDKFISDKIEEERRIENSDIRIIRLPFKNGYKLNCKEAGNRVNSFNPDWISLQYVPFAFHSKGLPFGLARSLSKLGKGVRWHVMVHELWVGMDQEASLKFIYWGWVQKQLIKSLLTKLKPAVIHTQSNLYIKMLEKIGFKANHLPLFGNIPVVFNAIKNDFKYPALNHIHQTISFVVFGNIHHSAPIELFANEARLYKINSGLNVVLKTIGRCGTEQTHWEKTWREAGLTIEILGEQPEDIISQVLSMASFGISTTPASLIEKSGTVAAMREHGLAVLCVSRSWHPRGFQELQLPEGVIQYKEGELKEFITAHPHKNNSTNISDISRQMTNSLQFAY